MQSDICDFMFMHCTVVFTHWECIQCQGNDLSWSHIVALYQRNGGAATGLNMLPKLKYEHVYLTSHSKMRVDLAAQVSTYTMANMSDIM